MASKVLPGGLDVNQCEPTDWFVVFDTKSSAKWIDWLACGRFKHVSCFGFVERAQTWVFFDFQLDRTRLYAVGNHEADIMIGEYSTGKTVVRIAKPLVPEFGKNWTTGLWCVPAVAHIIGLRTCALRPDALFRQCLAQGGEIIGPEGDHHENSEAPSRSGTGSSESGGGAGEGQRDPGPAFDRN